MIQNKKINDLAFQLNPCVFCKEYNVFTCKKDETCHYNSLWSKLINEIEKLEHENNTLRLKISYMIDPNCIGDKHEMGCF